MKDFEREKKKKRRIMPVKLQIKDMAQSSWLAESIDGFSLDKPG